MSLAGGNPFWKGKRKSEIYFLNIWNENNLRYSPEDHVKPSAFKSYFEISYQNWMMVFERNPFFWLLPVSFKN